LTFTDAAFDQDVLRSDVPVLVDFWAEWCGPCRQIAPAIDALATEYAGKAKIGKLDVDSNGGTAMRYNVRGIPTLLLFKGGKVVEQRVGAVGKSELQKMIEAHVDASAINGAPAAPGAPAAQKKVETPVPVTAEKV
jgi:thioredoxin 1